MLEGRLRVPLQRPLHPEVNLIHSALNQIHSDLNLIHHEVILLTLAEAALLFLSLALMLR